VIGDRRKVDRLPGGGFTYALVDDGVRIEARYLRKDHGQVHAEVTVLCEWAGIKNPLSSSFLNMSSQPTRKGLAKYCEQRAKTKPEDFDWHDAIDAACIAFIEADREGDQPIVLDDAPDVVDRDHDIVGLKVPADAASMLIAHGDGLKSMVMLTALGTVAQRGIPALYVDNEWTPARHRARKRRLFGSDRLEHLHYMRCFAPLVVECDRIRRYCDEHKIEMIGVDSVGLACDGKLSDDDTAIRFHRALASLPPSLCAAHVPKSSLGPEAKGDAVGPFGSVFFSNLCRMSWLLKKQPGATDDIVTVGFFPQKQNDGARQRPVGLEFTFTPERIHVRNVDLATVEGLAERMPLQARMIGLLRRGPRSYAEIAAELDAKVDSVIKTAGRHGDQFTKVPSTDGITRLALVERRTA
jgi:hypothetical protein